MRRRALDREFGAPSALQDVIDVAVADVVDDFLPGSYPADPVVAEIGDS